MTKQAPLNQEQLHKKRLSNQTPKDEALLKRENFGQIQPHPPMTSQKENYNVIMPDSHVPLGIKKRNHNTNEIMQFTIEPKSIFYDKRTTLMIKNIPNKYTQQMLRDAIDKTHEGLYDFLYLPIDFQNKCNVGYGFINFRTLKAVESFYNRFHNRGWMHFNSEKICNITYGRIQGFWNLKKHFGNSSIMMQTDEKLKPIIFEKKKY